MMFKGFWEMMYGNRLNVALDMHSQGAFGNVCRFLVVQCSGVGTLQASSG